MEKAPGQQQPMLLGFGFFKKAMRYKASSSPFPLPYRQPHQGWEQELRGQPCNACDLLKPNALLQGV